MISRHELFTVYQNLRDSGSIFREHGSHRPEFTKTEDHIVIFRLHFGFLFYPCFPSLPITQTRTHPVPPTLPAAPDRAHPL